MRSFLAALVCLCGLSAAANPSEPAVTVVTLPAEGIQPQAVADATGTIHVVYFVGPPASGDLFYAAMRAGQHSFGPPIRVNSEAGTAIATGSVRGGQIAIGSRGWVHVTWNGSRPVERNGEKVTPNWYARLAPGAAAFEVQRMIGTRTRHLDGGGTVAADARGTVFVAWHAAGPVDGETQRRVYVAVSHDNGARFEPERSVVESGGVCGCCGLRSIVDGKGRLQLLYRAATENIHRDATWLTVAGARPAAPVKLHDWQLPACPMTTFALTQSPAGIVAAWETANQIYTSNLDPEGRTFSAPIPLEGTATRKHPSVAVNAAGDRLIAWTEGTAWARGGTLSWQVQDRGGRIRTTEANAGPVPVWGLVAAVARRDGSFVIIR